MRINEPVSQREFELPDGITLVSVTDLQSHITYCNPNFVSVSGYEKDELLGQPHNLIRHPDMPPEAFRDMWATLREGHPWSGLVKNRRKNGDHYWVVANVTPVITHGKVTGYMSVRTKASRQQIQGAQALYQKMNQERARGVLRIRLHHGAVQARGWQKLGRWARHGKGLLPGTVGGAVAPGLALLLPSQPVLAIGLGAMLGTAAMLWMRRSLMERAGKLVATANRIAAGDLTQQIEVDDQGAFARMAKALRQVSVNLQAIVADVRREVEALSLRSAEIEAGNTDLAVRTDSQAGSLQQTASAMEQITAAVQSTAEATEQAASLSVRSNEVTGHTGQAMTQVEQQMGQIRNEARRIAEINRVIDQISFQTHLLALNASVEAARAGTEGRGFAVVAQEVRSLARRAADAASEINTLVSSSAHTVESSTQHVGQAGHAIRDAISTSQEVAGLLQQISRAVNEQAAGIAQVNTTVTHLDDITQQNAALVQQLAGVASALNDRSRAMTEAVSIFQVVSDRRRAA